VATGVSRNIQNLYSSFMHICKHGGGEGKCICWYASRQFQLWLTVERKCILRRRIRVLWGQGNEVAKRQPSCAMHSTELWIKDVQPEIQCEYEVVFRFVLMGQHDIRTKICMRNSSSTSMYTAPVTVFSLKQKPAWLRLARAQGTLEI
jgi:hypothetical protein